MSNSDTLTLFIEKVNPNKLGIIIYNVENPDMGSFEVSQGTIVPKAMEINFDEPPISFSKISEQTIVSAW